MDLSCLTVQLVESLQTLHRKGKSVAHIVSRLERATLAGICEYGCLRHWQPVDFPALPESVAGSPLGCALREVRSELGLRDNGPEKPRVRSVRGHSVEFQSLPMDADLANDVEWGNFCQRFESASVHIGFTSSEAANLQSALFEMAENALIHSRSSVSPLIGYAVQDGAAIFTVADAGIGVLRSLKSSPLYSTLETDVDAIQLAMKTGVTSRQGEHGGFGFNSVFKALAEQWGSLRFRSGNGCITMDGLDLNTDKSVRHFPPGMPGFQASVHCRAGGKLKAESRM